MNKINFVIYAPKFKETKGGIIVLHKLAHILSKLGEKSYITNISHSKNAAKYISVEEIELLDKNNTMFIYPEIVKGNPYNGKYVTRWILNTPGIIGGDGIYEETDLVYKYCDYFKAPDESKVSGELRCMDLKINLFKNKNLSRSGECFLIKKGKYFNKKLEYHEENALNLDTFISNEYLAEQFNIKEKFISYDSMTYHSVQAALCGCLSIVIPDPGITKEEWISKNPLQKYGIAYGPNDIQWAKDTLHLVKPNLLQQNKDSIILIKNYIKHCYNHIFK